MPLKRKYKTRPRRYTKSYLKGSKLAKLASGTYVQRRFAPPVMNGRVGVALDNAYAAAEQAAQAALRAEISLIRDDSARLAGQNDRLRGAVRSQYEGRQLAEKVLRIYQDQDRVYRPRKRKNPYLGVPRIIGDGDYEILRSAFGHVKDAARKGLNVAGDHLVTVGKAAAMEALRRGVMALI